MHRSQNINSKTKYKYQLFRKYTVNRTGGVILHPSCFYHFFNLSKTKEHDSINVD